MKKFLSIALILAASVCIFAQEKTIEQAEFDAAFKNSFTRLAGAPRRETRIHRTAFQVIPQANDSVNLTAGMTPRTTSSKMVAEFLPAVGYRSTYEFTSQSLNVKKETIRIANKTYTREGSGEWTETVPAVAAKPENTTKTVDVRIEYKFLGNEKLDSQNANVYEKIEKSKLVDLKNNRESDSITKTKHWFGEDGRLLKTESRREIRSENSVGNFDSITIYEVDANIKIEAPVIRAVKF